MSRNALLDTITLHGIQLDVTFYFWKGRAGCYSGPPEDCYESEPDEWDIERVVAVSGDNRVDITDIILESDTLTGQLISKLEEVSLAQHERVDYDPSDTF